MARLKNTLFCLMTLACYIANKCIDAVKLRDAEETINLCPGMMYAVTCTKSNTNYNFLAKTDIVFALRNETNQRPQMQDTFSNYLGSYDIAKGETNISGSTFRQDVYLILKNLRAEDDGKQFTCAYENDSTRRTVDEHFDEGHYVKLQILPSTVCDGMYITPPVAIETTKATQPTTTGELTTSTTTSEKFITSMRVTYKENLPKPAPGRDTNDKYKCTGKSTNIVANILVTFLVAIFASAMLVV